MLQVHDCAISKARRTAIGGAYRFAARYLASIQVVLFTIVVNIDLYYMHHVI